MLRQLPRAVLLIAYILTAANVAFMATSLLVGPGTPDLTRPPVVTLCATLTAVALAGVLIALRARREYLALFGLPSLLAALTLVADLRTAVVDSVTFPLVVSSAEMVLALAVLGTLAVLTRPFRPHTATARQSYARLLEFVRAHPGALLYQPATGVTYGCFPHAPGVVRVDRGTAELPKVDAEVGFSTVEIYRFVPQAGYLRRFVSQMPLRLGPDHRVTPLPGLLRHRSSPWRDLIALRFAGRTGLGVVTTAEADDLLRQLTEAEMSR